MRWFGNAGVGESEAPDAVMRTKARKLKWKGLPEQRKELASKK
jgi:hypothetical protein